MWITTSKNGDHGRLFWMPILPLQAASILTAKSPEGLISSGVGDDQRIPAVVCFLLSPMLFHSRGSYIRL